MKKTLLALVLMIALTGCKNDPKESAISEIAKEVKKELIVKINFKTNKKDIFRIMMNNIVVDDLQKKNIQIFEEVIPSTGVDQIIAKFDPNNISKNIVISLGNKEEKEVKIESIELSYGENSELVKAEDLPKHFILNKFTSFDENTFIVKTIRVDGKHAPTLALRPKALNKLTKAKQ